MKFFDPNKKKDQPTPPAGTPPSYVPPAAPSSQIPETPVRNAPPVAANRTSQTILGAGIMIRGDVKSDENMTIDGMLEGTVDSSRDVFIGPEGKVKADIRAANVIIAGKVVGNVTAMNKVDLTTSGQLQGNIRAPRLSIAESALFKGNIDMSPPDAAPSGQNKKAEKAEKEEASPTPAL